MGIGVYAIEPGQKRSRNVVYFLSSGSGFQGNAGLLAILARANGRECEGK